MAQPRGAEDGEVPKVSPWIRGARERAWKDVGGTTRERGRVACHGRRGRVRAPQLPSHLAHEQKGRDGGR